MCNTNETTTPPTTTSRFVTVAEAAKELACCEETVRRLVRRGRVQAIKVGAHYRLRVAEAAAALAVAVS